MHVTGRLFFVSLFTLMTIAPASAAWQPVGRVDFGTGLRGDYIPGLDRPVRTLALTARNNPVVCRTIRADLQSEHPLDIFSGRLPQGRTIRIDLSDDGHIIRRLTFRCRATHNTAFVEVAADTVMRDHGPPGPGYRDRHPPRLDREDGGVARPENWALWRRLGAEHFDGRNDREIAFAGQRGHRVVALALRPINADATCRQVVAQFFNGSRRALNISRYRIMRRGQFYVLDIPGDAATVVRLAMVCEAVGDRDVRIDIYAKGRR